MKFLCRKHGTRIEDAFENGLTKAKENIIAAVRVINYHKTNLFNFPKQLSISTFGFNTLV